MEIGVLGWLATLLVALSLLIFASARAVSTPLHRTYTNAEREGTFTVSYVQPSQILLASLAAAPRCGENDDKPSLQSVPTFPAREVEGVHVRDGYLFLECELERIIGGFDEFSLIVGRVIASFARPDALREHDVDDQEIVYRLPLLAYLHPGRFAAIERSFSFPYHEGTPHPG